MTIRGKSFNPTAADLLAYRMSELSEEHHCAGWLVGLEYDLWELLLDTPPEKPAEWAMGEVQAADLDELRKLSVECGGWIIWQKGSDDPKDWGETWVPIEKWRLMFERAKSDPLLCVWCGSDKLISERRNERGPYWHGCRDCGKERP